jgi:hypothetical protein
MKATKRPATPTDKWVHAALRRVDDALAPLRAITPETNPAVMATLLEGLTPEQLQRAGDPMGIALAAEEARANAAALRAVISDGSDGSTSSVRQAVNAKLAHSEIHDALGGYIGQGSDPKRALSGGEGFGGGVRALMHAAGERLPAMPKRRGGSR